MSSGCVCKEKLRLFLFSGIDQGEVPTGPSLYPFNPWTRAHSYHQVPNFILLWHIITTGGKRNTEGGDLRS